MVELVANGTGKKSFCLQKMLFTVSVLIGKLYFHRTGNDTAFPHHRKTAFPARLLPFLREYNGIDKFKIPFVHVHDYDAP